MKLLLHLCCGPCSAWSAGALREETGTVAGLFFNPNIHPYSEYLRRLEALEADTPARGIDLLPPPEYRPEEYFRAVAGREEERCRHCYSLRLRETAGTARRLDFDAFSTTLLFSVYQKHDLVREIGEEAGREAGVAFLYRDLRPGWDEGRRLWAATGLYRQNYCGCLFSERERLMARARRTARRQARKAAVPDD